MYIMAIAAVLFGLLAYFTNTAITPRNEMAAQNTQIEAANFVTYRNAVIAYVESNTAFTGAVPTASLSLPITYQPISTWNNKVLAGGTVLVWGALPAGGGSSAQVAGAGSMAIGVAKLQGGNEVIIVPNSGYVIPIASGIVPVGDIASAVQVN